jgi:hypothetical protein
MAITGDFLVATDKSAVGTNGPPAGLLAQVDASQPKGARPVARRKFEVIDVVEVLQHWHAGRPKSVVAASLGVDPKTVRKYVKSAEEAGLSPGGPSLSRTEWAELVRGWFPELADARARSATHLVIDGHRDRIEPMLKANTVATVHQRLRDEHGLPGSGSVHVDRQSGCCREEPGVLSL